jgi:DNA-binding response OmpR family regulator
VATQPSDQIFRVLIVDRDPGTADSECTLLAQLGFEARAAYEVRTATEQVRSFRPHAVLLDVEMSPRGYQLGDELRRRSPLPRLFLVAVSEHADERHQMLALQSGFDSLLVKPVAPDLLCRLLQGWQAKLARGG